MHDDDEVCLCFHVTLGKVRRFLDRENPRVPSIISDCLGAGTGCRWCVPFLQELHAQHRAGRTPTLPFEPGNYASRRKHYHNTGERPKPEAWDDSSPPPAGAA